MIWLFLQYRSASNSPWQEIDIQEDQSIQLIKKLQHKLTWIPKA